MFKNRNQYKKSEKGFTFIELLTVMAIVAILGTIVIRPTLKDSRNRAKNAQIVTVMSTVDSAIEATRVDSNHTDTCNDFLSPGFLQKQKDTIEELGGVWDCESDATEYRIMVSLNNVSGVSSILAETAYAHHIGHYYCMNSDFIKHFTMFPSDNLPFPSCNDDDWVADSGDGDADNDGINDSADNCVNNVNPTQADADSDGIGDLCDPEPNGGGDGPTNGKQDICHKGKTINISDGAIPAHLNHGDYVGACS